MKRTLLWVIALLIAVAPALADVCRVECERERPPECPLHQQAPHRCSHDHTIASATLTRPIVDAQRPLVAAIVVTAPDAVLEPLAVDRSRIEHLHVLPLRSPHIDVLRI
jgi:hypothetical protein